MNHRTFRTALSICIAVLVLLSACEGRSDPAASQAAEDDTTRQTIPHRIDGSLTFTRDGEDIGTIDIEIADTDSSRTRGMMQRENIPDDWGMLFAFPSEEDRGFWMANTPMALDLMFIDADSTIINIARYVQPMSAETITSDGPAQFVLEVEAGFSDTIGVIEGDHVTWSRTQ